MGNPHNKLLNLQVLRAIAALMVCCFHLQYFLMDKSGQVLFPNGWIGVQVFFVISGFIMYHSNKKDNIHVKNRPFNFIKNRIIRIVPLYFLVSLVQIADNLSGA